MAMLGRRLPISACPLSWPGDGAGVGKSAHKRRQHHVEQREQRHQGRALPFGGAARAQQFDGSHEQRVVSQGAEELRRHDGVEAALHGDEMVSRACLQGWPNAALL